MTAKIITQSYLHSILDYNKETGIFTWKVSRGNQFTKPGMKAGFKDTYGHSGIEINGKRFLSHRLAWLYVYGEWPKQQIDHINRIRDDNRIVNLRDVSQSENLQNRNPLTNNKSGYLGVSWSKPAKKWIAQIRRNNVQKYLGCFDTPELAHEAYLLASKNKE